MSLINYVILSLFILGCAKACEVPKQNRTHAIRKLKPTCDNVECKGGYAYQNNSGHWFLYHFIFSQSQLPYYGVNTAALSSVSGSKTWTQAISAPKETDFEQAEIDQNEIAEANAPKEMIETVHADVVEVEVNEQAIEMDAHESMLEDGTDSSDDYYSDDTDDEELN